MFPLGRDTDVRQRRWMAPSQETQDQRREIHGNTQSCDRIKEFLQRKIPEGGPTTAPNMDGAKGPRGLAAVPRTKPQWSNKKNSKLYTRPPILRATPTTNEWQCAGCGQTNWMPRKECHHCHKQPPSPSNPMISKKMPSGSTANPSQTWADVAKPKSDKMTDKSSFQLGNAQTPPEVLVKEGEPASQDSQIAQYEKAIAALPEEAFCGTTSNQKIVPRRVRVKLAQNGGHEKPTYTLPKPKSGRFTPSVFAMCVFSENCAPR